MRSDEKNLENICVISGRGPIYTVEEVSDLLGIPRPTLYRYLREYSIPHLRRSGRISIPEESFERIREARDLHKEGLGTESVRRVLREGGVPHTGELKERLDQLSENLERFRSGRPATDDMPPSHALRTILARQNLLISAMSNLTEMVDELLVASGKPRKAVFDDVGGEIQVITPPLEHNGRRLETPEGVAATTELAPKPTLTRRAGFGSLARRRRRGALVILSGLMAGLLLMWAIPALGGTPGLPFFDGREADEGSLAAPAVKDVETAQNPAADGEARDAAAGSAGEADRVEVPDVSDRNVKRAARVLSEAGIEVDGVKSVASREEPGTVTGTEPAEGSAVEPETPVVLVMSGGPTGIPPVLREGGGGATAAQYAN
jgi:excisionase family DNA binding protein